MHLAWPLGKYCLGRPKPARKPSTLNALICALFFVAALHLAWQLCRWRRRVRTNAMLGTPNKNRLPTTIQNHVYLNSFSMKQFKRSRNKQVIEGLSKWANTYNESATYGPAIRHCVRPLGVLVRGNQKISRNQIYFGENLCDVLRFEVFPNPWHVLSIIPFPCLEKYSSRYQTANFYATALCLEARSLRARVPKRYANRLASSSSCDAVQVRQHVKTGNFLNGLWR